MIVPEYIKPLLSDVHTEQECLTKAILNIGESDRFHVLHNGVVELILDNLYICPEDNDYLRVLLQPVDNDSLYVVYDGRLYGYDNMFCDEYPESQLPLKQLELNGSIVFSGDIILGYNIDYEDEKDYFPIDENGMVEVMNRTDKISWKQAKEEGYDYIHISFVNEKGDSVFVDFELA